MSKMGNHVAGLQERSAFRFGWEAAERGNMRYPPFGRGVDREAWLLGYDSFANDQVSP